MNEVVSKAPALRKPPLQRWQGLLRVHYSFFLLFIVLMLEWQDSVSHLIATVMGLVCAIALHEGGHLIVSQRFLSRPINGTLYAFGVAWESDKRFIALTPHLTWKEVGFALAGPFFNLMGAAFALLLSELIRHTSPETASYISTFGFCQITLGCAHLLPILPLDGGIIYRSIVERSALSTSQAASQADVRLRLLNISQAAAIIATILALLSGNFVVAVSAGALLYSIIRLHLEESSVRALQGKLVESHMRPYDRLDIIPHGASLERALVIGSTSFQDTFPVVHSRKLLGFINKDALLGIRSHTAPQTSVAQLIDRNFTTVDPSDSLDSILTEQSLSSSVPIAVIREDTFLGILLPRQLLETLLIDQVAKEASTLTRDDDDFSF